MESASSSRTTKQARAIIVMGVAGSGKSTIGRELAKRLGCPFFDGDDFHSPANIIKMAHGRGLTDDDRWPWLDTLANLIEKNLQAGQSLVLACSALREAYRRRMLPKEASWLPTTVFVYLKITPELARSRMAARKDHFMPLALLENQFETLEEPNDALELDASRPEEEMVRNTLAALT